MLMIDLYLLNLLHHIKSVYKSFLTLDSSIVSTQVKLVIVCEGSVLGAEGDRAFGQLVLAP